MYKYHCTNCSYVYNPYIGEEEQWIDPWTDFDDIDENWHCPSCNEPKDSFIELMETIHESSNIDDLFPQEESHIPFYWESDNRLFVRIWSEDEIFVQDDVHFVEYIWIYDDSWDVLDIKDFPNSDEVTEFEIPDNDDYEVRASCTLHWVWRWIKINKPLWDN
jgi:rubredoxin